MSDHDAVIWIADGGRMTLDRSSLRLRIRTPEPMTDEAILHPFLALPAAIAGRWAGRLGLHGGAFVHGEGAIAVLAEREGGKSSTLAALMRRGVPVVTDDVLVLDGLELFAGPRTVDLRADAAAVLGGEPYGVLGARERWRLEPPAVPPAVPLRGIVHLSWGDERLEPVDPADRLAALVGQCVFHPQRADALALLELVALPTWRLVRPPDIGRIERCVDQLLDGLPAD